MYKIKYSYLLILLLSFLFAFLVGGSMPYFLLYIGILSFLIPLGHILISLIGLKASLSVDKSEIYAGDSINLKYKLKNKSFFTIPILKSYLYIGEASKEENSIYNQLSLDPFEENIFEEIITFKRRGSYEDMRLRMEISDIYSLFRLAKEINNRVDLVVYPNIIELDSFKISTDGTFGSIAVEDSIFQDKSSISSIRDYREGDSINLIHWKVSAKRGSPMMKSFENISNTNIHIFIENNRSFYKDDIDYRMEDKLVDSALALVYHVLNLDIKLSLNTFSKEDSLEIDNRGKNDLKFFLEFFARFEANGEKSVLNLLEDKFRSFTKNSIVIIISPVLDKNMGEIALKLKMKGLIPIILFISDTTNNNLNMDKDIKERLAEENIDVYLIDYKSNIKEVLEMKNEQIKI